MKVKIKKVRDEIDVPRYEAAAGRLAALLSQVKMLLIGRRSELEAVQLALLTKEHVMLDGPPGCAKTRLAREVFDRIENARLFRCQLMKGTLADEIFGPLDSLKYKNEAVWERKIEGSLPDSHFAILDEVYRASEMLLPSMLGILNEREYHNGPVVVDCPLLTAVGTCNFVVSEKDLEAFQDRWLIHVKVTPLTTAKERIQMLEVENSRRRGQMKEAYSTVSFSLDDLLLLQEAVDRVKVAEDVLEMYEGLVSSYKKRRQGMFLSDRRVVQSLRLAQAYWLLSATQAALNEAPMTMQNLYATRFGLCSVNDQEGLKAFDDSYNEVITMYEQLEKENNMIGLFVQVRDKMLSRFDEKMSKSKATELESEISKVLQGLTDMGPAHKPKSPPNQEKLQKVEDDLKSLQVSVRQIISK